MQFTISDKRYESMATFWAIVIGSLFVLAVGALVVFGARALRSQSNASTGKNSLPSSKDKQARNRRESRIEQEDSAEETTTYEGRTRVYRH